MNEFPASAVAYGFIRCGLTDEWEDACMDRDTRIISRSTHNQWYHEQRKQIRRFASRLKFDLNQCFFECEGSIHSALVIKQPLSKRAKLAELFNVVDSGCVVIVDDRKRLDDDTITQQFVCREFAAKNVPIIEAVSGMVLTANANWKIELSNAPRQNLIESKRQIQLWKSMATHQRTGKSVGRKSFGYTVEQDMVVKRIGELYKKLPRDQRRRGRTRRSFREIARVLDQEGQLSPTGVKWNGKTVERVLRRYQLLKPE